MRKKKCMAMAMGRAGQLTNLMYNLKQHIHEISGFAVYFKFLRIRKQNVSKDCYAKD